MVICGCEQNAMDKFNIVIPSNVYNVEYGSVRAI